MQNNRATDLEWIKSLKPGWQRERDNAFLLSQTGVKATYPLDDGFTRTLHSLFSLVRRRAETGEGAEYTQEELVQLADFRLLERIRKRVDEVVKDKETAEKLKPWCACRRIFLRWFALWN